MASEDTAPEATTLYYAYCSIERRQVSIPSEDWNIARMAAEGHGRGTGHMNYVQQVRTTYTGIGDGDKPDD